MLYAAIAAVALYCMRLWGNKQWAKGEQAGRVAATEELLKVNEAKWKLQQSQIDVLTDQVEKGRVELDKLQKQYAVERQVTLGALDKALAAAKAVQQVKVVEVDKIPSNELDGTIRQEVGLPVAVPPESPLVDAEKRVVIVQLIKTASLAIQVAAYQDFVQKEQVQHDQEQLGNAKALEIEKQATSLAQKERDLQKERADMYEQLYKSVTKKPGVGCWIWRILTLGIHNCR
jgi:hypothetical protein